MKMYIKKISLFEIQENNNQEFESIEPEEVAYICEHCGKEVKEDYCSDEECIQCPHCTKLKTVELIGTKDITEERMGKEFGKYSYCSCCEELTLNVEGVKYNKLFSEYTEDDFKWHEDIEYDPNYILYTKKLQNKEIEWEEWHKLYFTFKKTVPTLEQLQKRFFKCEDCEEEKFWNYSYTCPKCDCSEHYFIEASKPVFSMVKSMEYGGNPLDWTETWMCKCCGEIYEIDNSNC